MGELGGEQKQRLQELKAYVHRIEASTPDVELDGWEDLERFVRRIIRYLK